MPTIVPPISLDSSLATHPGSRGEEARDVSEYGRAGFDEEPRSAGGPAEAVGRIMRSGTGRGVGRARRGKQSLRTACDGGQRQTRPVTGSTNNLSGFPPGGTGVVSAAEILQHLNERTRRWTVDIDDQNLRDLR